MTVLKSVENRIVQNDGHGPTEMPSKVTVRIAASYHPGTSSTRAGTADGRALSFCSHAGTTTGTCRTRTRSNMGCVRRVDGGAGAPGASGGACTSAAPDGAPPPGGADVAVTGAGPPKAAGWGPGSPDAAAAAGGGLPCGAPEPRWGRKDTRSDPGLLGRLYECPTGEVHCASLSGSHVRMYRVKYKLMHALHCTQWPQDHECGCIPSRCDRHGAQKTCPQSVMHA